MMKLFTLMMGLLLIAPNVHATEYNIVSDQSSIEFSGTHAGNEFKGEFTEWDVQIKFDPADLENSQISATFNLASAKTGNKMYDGTLPQSDWFDVKNHPEAKFQSTKITANEDGSYALEGDLTIRGITNPALFNFSLSDLNTSPVTVQGKITVDRLAYDIGKKSDAKAEWVSQNIEIKLNLVTTSVE